MSGPDTFHPATRDVWVARWHRHKRFGTAALVALAGLSLLAFGPAGFALGFHQYTVHTERAHLEKQPVGDEVRDGEVVFVVHEVRCGPAGPAESVHGRLCDVTLSARNDGVHPVHVPADRQLLAGPDGLRHLPTIADPAPLGTLSPGAAATSVLTYDLPEQATITHVMVHGGPYTSGEPVGLSGPPLPRGEVPTPPTQDTDERPAVPPEDAFERPAAPSRGTASGADGD